MTDVSIRPYRSADHDAGRRLWAELTERDDVPTIGGVVRGVFEEYLTRLDLSGVWVAERSDDGVVGLVGLLMAGRVGRVEPVVVAAHRRGRGIGRALLGRVTEEARRRGLAGLTVTPQSRDVDVLRCLHAAGYDLLSAVELTIDLRARPDAAHQELDLHGLRFRC